MFSVLSELTVQLFPGSVDTLFVQDAYLCKQCVRLVRKFTNTKESLRAQEKDLRDKITRAGEAKGLSCYNMRAEEGILHCLYT